MTENSTAMAEISEIDVRGAALAAVPSAYCFAGATLALLVGSAVLAG